jgi:hypothetical protein
MFKRKYGSQYPNEQPKLLQVEASSKNWGQGEVAQCITKFMEISDFLVAHI